ncbi:hypothetical protein GCM10010317_023430 [Streptomyces mirabilis]|nr:hypothetical protein GCM10010317_023430 [Streptomyces mirabilis]
MSPRRWDFISENRAAFGVKRICRVLGVSRFGYYQHRATADARTERAVAPMAPRASMPNSAPAGERSAVSA